MKAKIAVLMVGCIMAAACKDMPKVAPQPQQTQNTQQSQVSASDDEVEKRIKTVGESYDGLYRYDYDSIQGGINGFFSNSARKSMTTGAPTMAEAEMATDNCDDCMPSEPFPGVIYEEPDWNTEGFNEVKESGIVSVQTQPFSTFGADVDTAAYSNLRRRLYENDGHGITDNALRVEELVNYFGYNYPKAKDGEKFGVVTSLTSCPWVEDKNTMLLRIGIKAEEIDASKGSNIVFLVDTSGSMFDNNKLPLVQKSLKTLQAQLTDKDTVSIVTYAGEDRVVCEGVKGSNHEAITKAIDSFEAWGSTNGEGGINRAYEIAEKYFVKGGNNRVILATDGDLNVGVSSEAGLIELIEEKKKSDIFLSCLGFGDGNYQDNKMEALADHGNGNYAYIDCSREADRVLKDELWSTLYTVAKDVKFQVEFNPAKVKGYRLIGYENRAMAAEDFANDAKDGGEVGSGQCVTALYEVITAESDREIPNVESRYNNSNQGVDGDELLTVNIRYKEPDASESQLKVYPVTKDMYTETMDDDTSWAAGVAQFGMLMRGSEYKGTSSYQEIYDRLKKDGRVMNDDLRAEFLYIVGIVNGNIKPMTHDR
ncbi:MAG: von Willebrand factor type A domain-containing protein [Firmicutes bacterium]|nr:von Willebrand factor type A domain-containing protein [Bacillota bacterium]